MAAVLALMFVPALAAVLFMLGALPRALDLGSIMAVVVFLALATGLILGAMRLARGWEDEGDHEHPR